MIALGPAMQYVDEVKTDPVTLRIAPFAGDGRTEFEVAVTDGFVPVTYTAQGGRHAVQVGPGEAHFEVDSLTPMDIKVERG